MDAKATSGWLLSFYADCRSGQRSARRYFSGAQTFAGLQCRMHCPFRRPTLRRCSVSRGRLGERCRASAAQLKDCRASLTFLHVESRLNSALMHCCASCTTGIALVTKADHDQIQRALAPVRCSSDRCVDASCLRTAPRRFGSARVPRHGHGAGLQPDHLKSACRQQRGSAGFSGRANSRQRAQGRGRVPEHPGAS